MTHQCEQKDCKHDEVKFCVHCQKVYCVKCGKEWAEPCKLNHDYNPLINWTYYNPPSVTIPPSPSWIPPYVVICQTADSQGQTIAGTLNKLQSLNHL